MLLEFFISYIVKPLILILLFGLDCEYPECRSEIGNSSVHILCITYSLVSKKNIHSNFLNE